MIDFQIHDDSDTVLPTDWIRPLVFQDEFGGPHFFSTFDRRPINNLRWVPVSYVLGKCWWGKPAGHINKELAEVGLHYEFGRGVLPSKHVWNFFSERNNE